MLLSRNFSVVSLCSELRGKCSPDCPGGGMLWHFRPTSRRARWKLSILLTAFIPSGRVLVGEGVLTKACRKKPKPRWRSVFDIFVPWSSQFIFPKIGSFSSSMICSSMETLWSTRKSTTNRWHFWLYKLKTYPAFCSTWFPWRKLNWNPWRMRGSLRMAGFYVPGGPQMLCLGAL